jgi:cell division protein FtsB
MGRSATGRPRPRLTSRAAVLAAVICAVILTLAYPVREYIAQRRQVSALAAQQHAFQAQISSLRDEQRRLADPAYIEQLARDRLHMCLPRQECYEIIGATSPAGRAQQRSVPPGPWYDKLWQSVREAGQPQPR